MIVKGKQVDVNDYFMSIGEGEWKCIIAGCPSTVHSESKGAHLKRVHYEMFGLPEPANAGKKGRPYLTKVPIEDLRSAYMKIPGRKADLKGDFHGA